ncbi:hypothetical protein HU200_003619 [Digitaria exilis]|uniref:MADS-box domain-containing protein n=1 Tax=Digitaria exilis TaxID=1010633 RepID=A0A835FWK6_9POAL|nr:hypothetical protein HU200_003619 [Digitaria exilis]
MKRKKTMGRQKIEIKPIKCIDARNVCFSKRRHGLFKKASELCALTGAHLAIIVFSPAGKPYSFGQPSVDALIDGYLDPGSYVAATSEAEAAAQAAVLSENHGECERLEKAIEEEARRRTALDAAARAAGVDDDDKVRGSGMPELVAMLAALERVQAEADAVKRAYEIFAAEEAAAAIMMQQQYASTTDAGGDAVQFQYSSGAGGAFTADGGGAGSSSHQEDMDLKLQMMMMGGNVSHGLPFAPAMLLPPDLPPRPPYNYGSDHNHIAGYGNVYGYGGYDLGDGSGHGAAAMGGYYGTTTTTMTCNFFG